MHPHPQRPQGVLDEKLDHVGFGIDAGCRDDISAFDLRALFGSHHFEHAIFFFGVPVLIRPTERVRRFEHRITRWLLTTYSFSAGEQRDAFFQRGHRRAKRYRWSIRIEEYREVLSAFGKFSEQHGKETVIFTCACSRVPARKTAVHHGSTTVILFLQDHFVNDATRLHAPQSKKPVRPGVSCFADKLSDCLVASNPSLLTQPQIGIDDITCGFIFSREMRQLGERLRGAVTPYS
ncbi:MAG: hypothetical protein AB7P69_19310 [Candidatus Binatia bacterium]